MGQKDERVSILHETVRNWTLQPGMHGDRRERKLGRNKLSDVDKIEISTHKPPAL